MPTLNINNDDIRLNSSSSDKVVVNGNLGIGTTSPGAKLTIGPSFATTNGFTIDTADSSHSQIIARKTSSKTAFGLLAWDTSVFLSAGIYYEGGAWVQNNHNGTNQLFNFTPGSGARWYASNNGSGSWNVSSDVQLWDDAAIWTSLVRSTRAGDSYFTGGSVGIGTTSPNEKLHVAGNIHAYAAGGIDAGLFASTSAGATTIAIRSNGITHFNGGNVGIGTTSPSTKLEVGNFLDAVTNKITVAARYEYEPEFNFRLGQSGTNLDWIGAVISSGDDGNYNGKILFKTANVGRDTPTTKMIIKANGNVGIGTTSPSYKLDVNVASNSDALRIQQAGTSKFILTGDGVMTWGSSAANGVLTWDTNIVYIGGLTNNALGLRTNGSEKVRITTGGDVGIGTTNPVYKLQVAGSAYVNGGTLFIDSEQYLRWGNSAQGIRGVNDTSLEFVSGSSERMRITAAGNVGIGTTSPYDKLEVNGAIAATGSVVGDSGQGHSTTLAVQSGVSYLYAVDWGAEFKPLSIQGKTISLETGTGSTSARVTIDNSGNVGIGTTSPSDILHVQKSGANTRMIVGNNAAYDQFIYFQGNNDWSIGIDNSNSNAFTLSNYSTIGTNDRLTVTTSGNVGIGTTSPSYKLDVNGTVNVAANNYYRIGGTAVAYVSGNEVQYGNQGGSDYVTISAGTSEKVRITTTGNVGIGTTSPDTPLFVQGGPAGTGSWNRTATLSATYPGLIFNSNGTKWGGMAYDYSAAMRFWINASNNDIFAGTLAMSILNNGNVGIGTTAPSEKLELSASGNIYGKIISTTTGGNAGVRFLSTGAREYGIFTDGDLRFYDFSASAERMRITSAGNVGISKTNPVYTLDVNGSFRLDGTNGDFIVGSTGNDIYFTRDGSNYFIADQANSAISFLMGTGYAQSLFLKNDGNVGIGTTSPFASLQVNSGNIAAYNNISTDGAQLYLGDTNFSNSSYWNSAPGIGAVYAPGTSVAGDLAFYVYTGAASSRTERMRIVTGGNVGIGTTSPTEKLHVDGNVIVTYNSSYQGINSVGNKAILARVSPTTGIINYAEYATAANLNGFVMGSDDARVKGNIATDSLEFITNGSTQVTVLSNGNVGIANTNPSEKLSVTGNIRMDNGTADGPQLVLGSSGFSDWNIDNFSGSLRAYYGSTEYTRLTSSGNFGIGVSPSYKLDVAGDTRITSGSLGVGVVPNATDGRIDASNDIVAYSSSDRRLKENITPIANALDKVKSLTGVEFDWKPEHKKAHGYEGHDTGVIAQEVQEVMPTAVRTNDTGYLAVRYEKLIGLLIEANKELAARVEELENKLK